MSKCLAIQSEKDNSPPVSVLKTHFVDDKNSAVLCLLRLKQTENRHANDSYLAGGSFRFYQSQLEYFYHLIPNDSMRFSNDRKGFPVKITSALCTRHQLLN